MFINDFAHSVVNRLCSVIRGDRKVVDRADWQRFRIRIYPTNACHIPTREPQSVRLAAERRYGIEVHECTIIADVLHSSTRFPLLQWSPHEFYRRSYYRPFQAFEIGMFNVVSFAHLARIGKPCLKLFDPHPVTHGSGRTAISSIVSGPGWPSVSSLDRRALRPNALAS